MSPDGPTRTAVVTGADGFLGWHLRCRMRALGGYDVVPLGRGDLDDELAMERAVKDADVVFHLAGVNRADPDVVERENVRLAESVVGALRRTGSGARVVYSNSIAVGTDSAYGRGKAAAARVLSAAGSLADVRLPNLFGEHGRPHYNSFVATFCHDLVHGRVPRVLEDRAVPLLHVQEAAQVLLDAADSDAVDVLPSARARTVSNVLGRLREFAAVYASGDVPALGSAFERNLFNTYRSYLFPQAYPMPATMRSDARGELFECVRARGGAGQTFMSTTAPGAIRGQHYHLGKFERFLVVSGSGEIALRRLLHDDVIRFRLSGSSPAWVDMPTLWAHSITNTGNSTLTTLFWTGELFDPAAPDTYPEPVERGGAA
jgi:UDP-2-acetamido-2,6-beta-L-arabino-hexul-4-ose reductase